MDFQTLIGLDIETARKILIDSGYNDIEEVINSKSNEKCNAKLVCAVKDKDNKIILICGEFFLNIKE